MPVVTPEWLTIRHSCIIAINMVYYSLPLWNPVLREAVLSVPWRHNSGAAPLILNLGHYMEKSDQFHAPATLPPGKNLCTLCIRGCMVLQPVWTFQRREKSHVSTGVQNPYLAACSIVTIAYSFTQTKWTNTSNQHTLQSPAHSLLLCQQS